MPVIISLLRGINVGGHHMIKMDALRALYASLGCEQVATHLQSGNVVFKTKARNLSTLRKSIEDAIEGKFGFRCDVVLRTAADLREAIGKNPFADRTGIEPNKLVVHFLAGDPSAEARAAVVRIKADPEELHIVGRELFIYFAAGMARPNLSIAQVEKALQTKGTSRNWNTVRKVLEIAEKLEGATSST